MELKGESAVECRRSCYHSILPFGRESLSEDTVTPPPEAETVTTTRVRDASRMHVTL